MTWLRRLRAWWTRPPLAVRQSVTRAMAREAARNRGDLALCRGTRAAMRAIPLRERMALEVRIRGDRSREVATR